MIVYNFPVHLHIVVLKAITIHRTNRTYQTEKPFVVEGWHSNIVTCIYKQGYILKANVIFLCPTKSNQNGDVIRHCCLLQTRNCFFLKQVVRLDERDRYKQLVAQFTTLQTPDHTEQSWNTTCEHPLEIETDFLTKTRSHAR